MKSLHNYRIVFYVVSILLLLSILLQVSLCFSSYPAGDDFANALPAKEAWDETHIVAKAITAGIQDSVRLYNEFQGTFSGVLLTRLNPMLISIFTYQISLVIINILIISSVFLLFYLVIVKRYNLDYSFWVFISSVALFISYNYLNSISQFMYNYISASLYSLTLAVTIIYFCLFYYLNNAKTKKSRITTFIIMIILSVFIGLNNFPCGIMTFCGLATVLFFSLIKKSKIRYHVLVLFLIYSVAFAVCVLAPGNTARTDSNWVEHFSMFNVFYSSFFLATKQIVYMLFITPLCITLLLITPILYYTGKSKKIQYIHPLLLLIFSYLILVSQYVPVLYSSGYDFHGRIENLKNVTTVLFIIVNYINFICFLSSKEKLLFLQKRLVSFGLAGILCISLIWLYQISPAVINDHLFPRRMHIVTTTNELLRGEIQSFDKQQNKRFSHLDNPEVDNVILGKLDYPYVICSCISEDEPYNKRLNRVKLNYYNKESVEME